LRVSTSGPGGGDQALDDARDRRQLDPAGSDVVDEVGLLDDVADRLALAASCFVGVSVNAGT
jgi:hypothetical protein